VGAQREKIQGFVPISHITEIATITNELTKYEMLVDYMHQTLALKIIECNPEQKRIVFSERAALAREGKRNDLFVHLNQYQYLNRFL